MSFYADVEAPRPRPLSGGLWTLFSWLRREDHSLSSESLSSTGSDRTAISFAFLPPANYLPATAPLILPPPGPPTDSYKKRVRDRNLRRQHDRDLTLHRKYGIYRGETDLGYDGFSLPSARKSGPGDRSERDRRATSECQQRRVAHVPGKRRAPLPPTRASHTLSSTLINTRTRKRPAPQPPAKSPDKSKENIPLLETYRNFTTPMNTKPENNKNSDIVTQGKSEKYCKKDNTKTRPEKNFLKQIFENRKRNSTIDTAAIKILPSISELDKQAADIIKAHRVKNALAKNCLSDTEWSDENQTKEILTKGSTWICTNCLRKYEGSVISCPHCNMNVKRRSIDTPIPVANIFTQTEKKPLTNTSITKVSDSDERQKLKDMLKEMKDSLPKKSKNLRKGLLTPKEIRVEAPTLRIGSTTMNEEKPGPSTSIEITKELRNYVTPDLNVLKCDSNLSKSNKTQLELRSSNAGSNNVACTNLSKLPINDISKTSLTSPQYEENNLHKPLRISSLLNPCYVPKFVPEAKLQKSIPQIKVDPKQSEKLKAFISLAQASYAPKNVMNSASTSQEIHFTKMDEKDRLTEREDKTVKVKTNYPLRVGNEHSSKQCESKPKGTIIDGVNEHSRKRDLINQLERSIANGDERAAAEAAMKLAQLKLSCSVLSFSSQILGQPSTSGIILNKNVNLNDGSEVRSIKPVILQENLKDEAKINLKQAKINEVISKTSNTPNLHNKQLERQDLKNIQLGYEEPTTSLGCGPDRTKHNIMIEVWIEDKEATRGPVHLPINRYAVMKDLRRQAETTLGVATRLQRWIVGKSLCTDDNTPLNALAGANLSAPFYLCVVESDIEYTGLKDNIIKITEDDKDKKVGAVYSELVQLEKHALVPNSEPFECGVCIEKCESGAGVVLRECVHSFCKDCLTDMVRHCEEPVVSCPAVGCPGVLHEREIRALVIPEEYERWLARGLAAAESGTRNSFHCRTRDCNGWALCEPGVLRFPCPVCERTNCVPCQAIHEGVTCEQHRTNLQVIAKTADDKETDDGTKALLDTLLRKGEALACPECSAIITKKWGCDWIKCSACKTEICWVTRGRRWGPGGRGDTNGGCRCGVDGKKCHASCGYCH